MILGPTERRMADIRVHGDSRRRSTRVELRIVILLEGVTDPLMCDGETLVVNRHGALISASVPLEVELKIKIQVALTGMRAYAKVVHVDPERPQRCGIALEKPENIWDLPSPPDDWHETAHES